MKAPRSQVRTAGVMAAGRHPRRAAITSRKSKVALSSRSLFCPQDGLRSTSHRRKIEALRCTDQGKPDLVEAGLRQTVKRKKPLKIRGLVSSDYPAMRE